MIVFRQALFVLQPRRVPGFAFHWLDIIGNRNFIGRLLSDNNDNARTSAMYTQLILCHMKFLAPYLRNVQLPKPITVIYKVYILQVANFKKELPNLGDPANSARDPA